jgi:uncharacterized protein YegP (UPF0339 family)
MAGKFVLRKTHNGQFHFNLKTGNGEAILTGETYGAKHGASYGIAAARINALLDERFERKVASDGSPYFILKAANGEIIGRSEMYASASACENGLISVKTNAPTASIEDLTGA